MIQHTVAFRLAEGVDVELFLQRCSVKAHIPANTDADHLRG